VTNVDLILWRHAQAHLLREGETDLERKLTPKGERQAQRMADWLNQRLPDSTRVLVSPAQRCQQTVAALGRSYKLLDALRPDGSVEELLQATRWPSSSEPVLVVGHQPTLGLVAASLMSGLPQAWSIKKGAVWWLRQRETEDDVQSPVTLQAVQGPDCL
jgi:phosphohistidine phosphatase